MGYDFKKIEERENRLRRLIQEGSTDRAIALVQDAEHYFEAEKFVSVVLKESSSAPELIEIALDTFFGKRDNRRQEHGYWVHSLSHFTGILWERRLDEWIKKFNKVAFKGANELDDSNCSHRLVDDFVKYAKYDDSPIDFHLTSENLRWWDLELVKHHGYAKARIEAGRFESEEAFLRWKFRQPEVHTDFDYNLETNLVNIEEIRSIIQKLQELGADTSEFDNLERDLLTKQLSELEEKLSAVTQDRQRERLEGRIQQTRAALANIVG